jgi:hypothetical protein
VLVAPVTAGAVPEAIRAPAQPSDPTAAAAARVAAARQQADALASRYFAALNRGARLDVEITNLEARLRTEEANAAGLRARVAVRARQLYETAGSSLFSFFDGEDPLESARRSRLVAAATTRDNTVFTDLARQNEALRSRRKQLRDDQQQLQRVAAALHAAQTTMDAQLAAAQKALADAQSAAAAAARAAQQTAAAAPQRSGGRPVSQPPATIATPPIGAAPAGGAGGSHHDDPYLVCTRARESNGDYTVVNPAGPWYGAYQFAQSTWNSAANHAGRLDLVGVPPNAASPSDQDDVAWALYQWQGKGPWGGLC